jgi:hypothetical protein
MCSNQTGLFPQVSSLGNKYIMVIHNVNSNSLWVEALKDNTSGKLILGHAWALERMRKAGIVLKHQVLDNQASAAYKRAICNSDMTYELFPPDNHQCNMAEKAIQTSKDHFVGVLHLLCQLLPQVVRQLLLLQQPQLHPNLSAYAHVHGHHDYNKHPFVKNWDGGPSPQKTIPILHLCRTLKKGVYPWHIHQTLSVLEILVDGNPGNSNLGCRIFQA